MTLTILLVYALAVARVTRLINEDKLTNGFRHALLIRLWARHTGSRDSALIALYDEGAEQPLSVYLITCPWCVSIYVGIVAAPVAYWWGGEPWFLVPALALAFSYITGFLHTKIGG